MNLAYDLFKDVHEDNFEYIYRGIFTQNITDDILSLAEINLNKVEDGAKIKKRIYFIMVECLQNITRHQDESIIKSSEENGIFVIQKKKSRYFITTGNLIPIEKVVIIRSQLEKINSLAPDKLKVYYKEILESGTLSDKGGAGLGLIEMARKSGNKLSFDFKPINDNYSFFYLTTEVPFAQEAVSEDDGHIDYSLADIIKYHEILNKENILINFKGAFNQDNLLSLLSFVEGQMKESVFSIKAFNIMVEMLQNIVKHGDNIVPSEYGNLGIFFLSDVNKEYILTAGNYIKNDKIQPLQKKLEHVNDLPLHELDKFYDTTLLNPEIDDAKRSGLGIIDMRLKSEQKFDFNFHTVNNEYSFFSIKTGIKKITKIHLPIIIEETKDTPTVRFDPENNEFLVNGKSLPENALEFYEPIMDWTNNYLNNPLPKTIFEFQLDYFNTASAKQLIKFFLLLEKLPVKSEALVKWYHKKYDSDMLTQGIRFSKLVTVKFEFIEY